MAKAKTGRKALWDELDMNNRLEAVKGWALQGSTDAEIMQMLNVSKDTFYKWKKEKSEFAEVLKKGRFESNGEILKSAFNQATGYHVEVTEPFKVKRPVNLGTEKQPFWSEQDEIEMVTYQKFIPANNAMTIFMLKNRFADQFREKPSDSIRQEELKNTLLEKQIERAEVEIEKVKGGSDPSGGKTIIITGEEQMRAILNANNKG